MITFPPAFRGKLGTWAAPRSPRMCAQSSHDTLAIRTDDGKTIRGLTGLVGSTDMPTLAHVGPADRYLERRKEEEKQESCSASFRPSRCHGAVFPMVNPHDTKRIKELMGVSASRTMTPCR